MVFTSEGTISFPSICLSVGVSVCPNLDPEITQANFSYVKFGMWKGGNVYIMHIIFFSLHPCVCPSEVEIWIMWFDVINFKIVWLGE